MANVDINIKANDKASGKINNLTGSIIKGQLAVEGIKFAFKALVNVSKESVKLFAEQEKQEKQLEAVLKSTKNAAGLTATEIKRMASNFQELTTFGDETILTAQNLLLTFTKIGKDVFPDATETVLNMSQALGQDLKSSATQLGKALNDPIKGVTALQRVGVTFTEAQKATIQTMTEMGDVAGAQKLILKELAVEFGGSAKAARDTFGGALASLKNNQGDLLESVGQIVSVFGKDFVNAMSDSTKAIADFLKDANTMAGIGATFDVIKGIFIDIGKSAIGPLKDSFAQLKTEFAEMIPQGAKTGDLFTMIGGAVKLLSIGLGVAIKSLTIVINYFMDVITVGKDVITVLTSVWDVLSGKAQAGEVLANLKTVGESYVEVYKNLAAGAVDLVTSTIEEFKKLPDEAKTNGDNIQKAFKKSYDGIKKDIEGASSDIIGTHEEIEDSVPTPPESAKKSWNDYWGSIQGAAVNATSSISGYINQMFENVNAKSEESMNLRIEDIDTETEKKLEALGILDENSVAFKEKELLDLQNQLSRATSDEDRKALGDKIRDQQLEVAKTKILVDAETRKNNEKKKFAKEEFKRKLAAFNAQKAIDLVTAGAQTALGVASAAASGAQAGFPAAAVMIPLLVSLVAAAGIASIATIASKQAPAMPAFAAGVTGFGGGAAIVGERGPELVTMGKGSNVLTNENFTSLMSGMGGGITINNMTVISNDPRDFANQMIELQRYERAR